MTTDLVPISPPGGDRLPAFNPAAPDDVTAAFLAGRNPRTLRAYAADLEDFARFVGAASASAAVEALLGWTLGTANAAALGYRNHLTGRGLSSSTTARRLAALRSVVRCGRMLGRVAWTLDVDSPKAVRYRDTAGPGVSGWSAIWAAAVAAGDGPKARRDRAILRLLHDRALRRGELAALDRADAEMGADRPGVNVVGKGRTERERLTVNEPTRVALAEWVEARGSEPGPLFTRLDRGAAGQRVTGEGVRLIVLALSRAAGLDRDARPHGLRHTAITHALDLTGGNLRDVAAFSRHRDIRTLQVYDDRRTDVGGEIARMLGGDGKVAESGIITTPPEG